MWRDRLTCANKMSHQHVSETYKKLGRLQEDGKKRADQYEKALQRYRDTWASHQKVYCSFPGVPQIMLLEDEVAALRNKVQEREEQLKGIREKKEEMKELSIKDCDERNDNKRNSMIADQQEQDEDAGNSSEVVEQITVCEISMETTERMCEVNESNQHDGTSQNNEEEMDTIQGNTIAVDDRKVMDSVSEKMNVQSSPYFSNPQTSEKDDLMQGVGKEPATIPLPSSTPYITSSIPSASPFNNLSPVLPDPVSSDSNTIVPSPATSPNLSSAKVTNPGMVTSASVTRRSVPSYRINTLQKPSLPASPKVLPVKVFVPKLLKPASHVSFCPSPKLSKPALVASPKPLPRPVSQIPVPTTPNSSSYNTVGVTTPKLTSPRVVQTPRPVTTSKVFSSLKPFSSPKPLSKPKPVHTPRPLSTPKHLSTPKSFTTPKTFSTPNSSSTPNVYVTPKHISTKNVPDLASANPPKFAGSQRTKNPSKEEYFTPVAVAPTNNNDVQDTSVYTTPANATSTENTKAQDASFTFDQFATAQAGESMFEAADSTGDQFNFGFVESESASTSAFGMFGGAEDSSDFGGGSGSSGGNSTGFAFSFGEEDSGNSSENNCNALFG
ncbi:anti-sigma-I factor RsgI2-like isoform X2 [Bolinopsis microptera]|uniref:anti-sigma-I factor RsgI2-like isoform X2 n=1 Tax=Bolinopsis microptera TaxID=2820187 RepID=UPI00307AE319